MLKPHLFEFPLLLRLEEEAVAMQTGPGWHSVLVANLAHPYDINKPRSTPSHYALFFGDENEAHLVEEGLEPAEGLLVDVLLLGVVREEIRVHLHRRSNDHKNNQLFYPVNMTSVIVSAGAFPSYQISGHLYRSSRGYIHMPRGAWHIACSLEEHD